MCIKFISYVNVTKTTRKMGLHILWTVWSGYPRWFSFLPDAGCSSSILSLDFGKKCRMHSSETLSYFAREDKWWNREWWICPHWPSNTEKTKLKTIFHASRSFRNKLGANNLGYILLPLKLISKVAVLKKRNQIEIFESISAYLLFFLGDWANFLHLLQEKELWSDEDGRLLPREGCHISDIMAVIQ